MLQTCKQCCYTCNVMKMPLFWAFMIIVSKNSITLFASISNIFGDCLQSFIISWFDEIRFRQFFVKLRIILLSSKQISDIIYAKLSCVHFRSFAKYVENYVESVQSYWYWRKRSRMRCYLIHQKRVPHFEWRSTGICKA